MIPELLVNYNRCNAPVPFEPGPMCARPEGHEGDHVSASGLWKWPKQQEKDDSSVQDFSAK